MAGRVVINLGKLDNIRDAVAQKYVARVGILNDSTHTGENGKTIGMVELALIHIFGSITRNIPARDPLFIPLQSKKQRLLQSLAVPRVLDLLMEGNIKGILKIMGAEGEAIVQDAFATRGFGLWPPLMPATVKRKGSDAPLIDTSAFRKSFTSDVVKK